VASTSHGIFPEVVNDVGSRSMVFGEIVDGRPSVAVP
jgi:hypothetical protein